MHQPDRTPSPEQQAARQPEPSEKTVRLQKVMARAGVGSRRACEVLIESGMVSVNGQTVRELPCLVDPYTDRIEVQGRVLPRPERHVYVMLYKPKQTMCTLSDPGGRRTVADLVQHPSGTRLYPVGRLDFDTMGLVLMTNDGELANRLTHPRYGVHKTYRAVVKGSLSDEEVQRLEQGIYLAERREGRTVGARKTSRALLTPVKREPTRTILDIQLHEGRNRQIRRMMASVGCPVRRLVRIQMGPIALKGLQIGEWRELTASELARLRKAAWGGNAGEPELTSAGIPRKPRKGGRQPGGADDEQAALSGAADGASARRSRGRHASETDEHDEPRPLRALKPSPRSAMPDDRRQFGPAGAAAPAQRAVDARSSGSRRRPAGEAPASPDRGRARAGDRPARPFAQRPDSRDADRGGSLRDRRSGSPPAAGTGRPARPTQPDRSGRSDRGERPDRNGWNDRPSRPDRSGRPAGSDRPDRADRAARPDRAGAPRRSDRSGPGPRGPSRPASGPARASGSARPASSARPSQPARGGAHARRTDRPTRGRH